MIEWLKQLYHRLPVVRELRGFEATVSRSLRISQSANAVLVQEALKAGAPRYRDPRRLLVHGAQYWSQNYEDGMIAEIFRRIGVTARTFLEIGVGDGKENNTAALLATGWKGWWVDGDPEACGKIAAGLHAVPGARSRLQLKQAYISPENIAGLLKELDVPAEVDLFSLDIDQDTYHVWAALPHFKPRVVVMEYNAAFPADCAWIHPYRPGVFWDGTQAFGASLKAFELLGSQFGYSLVGCDISGINAFFVRNDLLAGHFVAPYTSENHFEPPRYYLFARCAHPSAFPFFESSTTPR